MRANLTSGSMRGDWRGGNPPDQPPTLLPSPDHFSNSNAVSQVSLMGQRRCHL